jgi:hypothetical protein
VKVQVSQTFTLITSLLDTGAFPAADIAALYGDRWSIELVFYELKVTVMTAGSTCRSPKPAGACQELLAAITVQTSLRLLGAHYAAQIGVPPWSGGIGAPCQDCSRWVSPILPPHPACGSHRTGRSMCPGRWISRMARPMARGTGRVSASRDSGNGPPARQTRR